MFQIQCPYVSDLERDDEGGSPFYRVLRVLHKFVSFNLHNSMSELRSLAEQV